MLYKIKNCYYTDEFPEELKGVLIEKANLISDAFLQNSREYIFEDDLPSIITLFQFLHFYQELDKERILKTYYENAEHAYELYLIKNIRNL